VESSWLVVWMACTSKEKRTGKTSVMRGEDMIFGTIPFVLRTSRFSCQGLPLSNNVHEILSGRERG